VELLTWCFRQERLARLADKIQRECKYADDSLADLERRIHDCEVKGHSLHPFEAKRNCEAMERSLMTLEEMVKAMFRDVQTLQDNHYPQAMMLYNRSAQSLAQK
jgi:septation ring formation regulator EzrA